MSSPDRPPGPALVSSGLRWLRNQSWPAWAAAGSVFLLFAVLGAVTHRPATTPTSSARLGDALERGTGKTPAAPAPAGAPTTVGTDEDHGYEGPRTVAATATPTPTATAALYADCAAAEAAGVAPIARGRPGYRPALDADGDGIACDTPPTAAATTPAPRTPIAPGPTASTPTPVPVPTTPDPTPSPTVDPTPEPTPVDPAVG